MSNINKYRAVNVKTGEVLEGRAEELADKIGVTKKAFYNAELCQFKAGGLWEIKKFEKTGKMSNRNVPQSIWEMWDAVTEPFKILSRERCSNRVENSYD